MRRPPRTRHPLSAKLPAVLAGTRRRRLGSSVLAFGMAAVALDPITALAAPASGSGPVVASARSSCGGGWDVTVGGTVRAFGGAPTFGSLAAAGTQVASIAATPDGEGYWLATTDGRVEPFGDARSYGSVPSGQPLAGRVVSLVPTPSGHGYWLGTSGGEVIPFGQAAWYGSARLLLGGARIVSMAAQPQGGGYWLATASGRVFSFGGARAFDAVGRDRLSSPIVAMAAAESGRGYWLAAADGAVVRFGDAKFYGAISATKVPVVSMVAGDSSYDLVSQTGRVFGFGHHGGGHCRTTTPPPATPPTTAPPTTAPPTTAPPTTTPPPATPPTTTPPTTGPPTTAPPTAPANGSQSFGLFNQPLADGATPNAAPATDYAHVLVADYQRFYGAVGVNEMPVWTVGASQATVSVSVAPGCNDFTSDTGTQIPIPPGVSTLGYGDSPLVIDQPSTHTEWELWKAMPAASGGGWQACWGGKLDTATSEGVFPSPFGMSASGISYLATTITEADVASGSIDHAIAVDLPGCTAPQVAPADRNDCSNDPGQPPYGTWFRFPATLAMPSGLTPFGQMVFKAIQTYGMVFTDQAGAVMIQAEDSSDWAAQGHSGVDPITASWNGQPEYNVVANLPWAQLQDVGS